MAQVREEFEQSGQAARIFRDFTYRTHKSWSRHRRVVGKAEHLAKGANPRFIVTSLSAESWPAAALYEQLYCARGEMENRGVHRTGAGPTSAWHVCLSGGDF